MHATKPRWNRENWPIAAAMNGFPGILPDGTSVQDQTIDQWAETLQLVVDAGFTEVDPSDSWLRFGCHTLRLNLGFCRFGRGRLDRNWCLISRHNSSRLRYNHLTCRIVARHYGWGNLIHRPLLVSRLIDHNALWRRHASTCRMSHLRRRRRRDCGQRGRRIWTQGNAGNRIVVIGALAS